MLVFYKGLHFAPYFLAFSTLISSVSPELLSAYSGSLSLSSTLDPPSPVTWFPLTLRATLAPPPLRRHPPTHTHGRPTVGSVFLRGRLRGDVAGNLQWFSVSDDGSFQHMVPTCPRRSRLHCLDLQEREKKQASAPRSALSLILTPTNTGGLGLRFITSQLCLLKKPERNE